MLEAGRSVYRAKAPLELRPRFCHCSGFWSDGLSFIPGRAAAVDVACSDREFIAVLCPLPIELCHDGRG